MRALLVGLGLVLTISGAQAAKEDARLGCRLDGLELVAEGHPKFEGKRFTVTKVQSGFNRVKSPATNDLKADGYVIALLEGDAGKFVLTETYAGYGMPADYGRLEPATTDKIQKINSKQRSSAGERSRVNGIFHIFNDDYEGLSFFPVACR